eukprot:1843649-Amphidinium_carterae.1
MSYRPKERLRSTGAHPPAFTVKTLRAWGSLPDPAPGLAWELGPGLALRLYKKKFLTVPPASPGGLIDVLPP